MKNGFKKAVALVLTAALGAALLTACGPVPGAPKDPVAVSVWHYYNGAQQATFNTLVEEFNQSVGAQQGIVVSAKSFGKIDELTNSVMDAMEEKVGAEAIPDIFSAYSDTAFAINEKGMAANLADYLTEEEQRAYIPAYLDEGRFGGEGFRIFPVAKSVELLTLNKTEWDKFSAATGITEEGLSTWEGLAETAKAYYDWTDSLTKDVLNDGKAFFGRDAFANYMIIGSYQLGTELFEVADGQVSLHVDESVMRRLWDNYYVPYISGYYASYGKFRSDDLRTGDIAAFVGATSGATYFPEEVTQADGTTYPIEGKVYPLPNFKDTKPVGVQQGAGMVVTKSNPEREGAAVAFLKWFTEKEQNIRFSCASGYLPVTAAANQPEELAKNLGKDGEAVPTVLRESLELGVKMSGSYTLYTTAPFANGYAARKIVDYSMADRAAEDRSLVQEKLAEGMTLEAAVAAVNTEEHFAAWLEDFKTQLEAAI